MGELPDGRGADLSNSTRIAGAVGNSLRNQQVDGASDPGKKARCGWLNREGQ
jgi:hypothetical protein